MDASEDPPGTHNSRWCGCVPLEAQVGTHPGEGAALWRVALAEGVGTALLVLLACAAAAAPSAVDFPLQQALSAGLVVTLLVQCFGQVSGAQLNPAVTLAACVWGRVRAPRALAEAAAQLAGAAAGAGALRALRPAAAARAVSRAALAAPAAACVEALLAACLALANCAAWDARSAGRSETWPLRLGLSVTALVLVGGELSGASMNPARSFGPALCSGDWTHHWVYWVGPLGGAALGTGLYVLAWRPHPHPHPHHQHTCDVTRRLTHSGKP